MPSTTKCALCNEDIEKDRILLKPELSDMEEDQTELQPFHFVCALRMLVVMINNRPAFADQCPVDWLLLQKRWRLKSDRTWIEK